MIIPSIDIMNGQAVQLVGGREKALDAGDPRVIAERFARVGELAVIDLDAALGRGSNAELVRDITQIARCRVGGGIRSVDAALDWLDAGAARVILGTAATPDVLRHLPRDRVMVALDTDAGEIVVEGWQTRTGRTVIDAIRELGEWAGSFLMTFVEREGRMCGLDLAACKSLIAAAGSTPITFAGGITSTAEIATLDQAGADAQIGMAIYTGAMNLADAFAAPLTTDREDGLWPTVVVDEHGIALGLAWSNAESLREAIDSGRGVYHSRRRGRWVKGETSGAEQILLRADLDCDRDSIRFTVRQHAPGFCHRSTWTCWGEDRGIGALSRRLAQIETTGHSASYTRRLLSDRELLNSKLREEANELAIAATPKDVIHEAADVMYFAMVSAIQAGVTFGDIERELDRRSLRVRRRRGAAKGAGHA